MRVKMLLKKPIKVVKEKTYGRGDLPEYLGDEYPNNYIIMKQTEPPGYIVASTEGGYYYEQEHVQDKKELEYYVGTGVDIEEEEVEDIYLSGLIEGVEKVWVLDL